VLVAVGPRSGSGYSIRVVRVTEERERIEVELRERAPTLAHPGRAGVTYPYRLIVLPSSDKHVTVRFLGRP
jgi:PrcB C-terminal